VVLLLVGEGGRIFSTESLRYATASSSTVGSLWVAFPGCLAPTGAGCVVVVVVVVAVDAVVVVIKMPPREINHAN